MVNEASAVRCVPILPVTDLDRAIAFYQRMGFDAVRYQGAAGYAFLRRHGFELHLALTDIPPAAGSAGSGVYLYLEDGTAAALEAEFLDAGVPVRSRLQVREWRMNEFVVVDPDENLLRFGEHVDAPTLG